MHVQGRQFSVSEVEVLAATVDIDEVISYRGAISSLQEQASNHDSHLQIPVAFSLCDRNAQKLLPSETLEPKYHLPEEEIALGRFIAHVTRSCVLQATLHQ